MENVVIESKQTNGKKNFFFHLNIVCCQSLCDDDNSHHTFGLSRLLTFRLITTKPHVLRLEPIPSTLLLRTFLKMFVLYISF